MLPSTYLNTNYSLSPAQDSNPFALKKNSGIGLNTNVSAFSPSDSPDYAIKLPSWTDESSKATQQYSPYSLGISTDKSNAIFDQRWNNPDQGFSFNNLLKDRYLASNTAGLASVLMQAAALPSMLKNARLQNESLRYNLETAKQEQANRNKLISSFNAPTYTA